MSLLSQAYEITMSSQLYSWNTLKIHEICQKQYGLKAARLMVSGKLHDSESRKYNWTSILHPFKS